MSARRGPVTAAARATVTAAAFTLFLAAPAWCGGVPAPEEAVEKARALVRQGHQSDAEAYLAELVREEDGPHAGNAIVLLEAARLATSSEDCRIYAARAIDRTRSDAVLEAAHMLRGDSYFAESLYISASQEYEEAARRSSERGPGLADLKRARSGRGLPDHRGLGRHAGRDDARGRSRARASAVGGRTGDGSC